MADKTAFIVSEINKSMMRHGYSLASVGQPVHTDAVTMRFVVAGDDVLAERLKPIVITVSGLEIVTCTDPVAMGKARASEAIKGATGKS